jgi:hypothetical protein
MEVLLSVLFRVHALTINQSSAVLDKIPTTQFLLNPAVEPVVLAKYFDDSGFKPVPTNFHWRKNIRTLPMLQEKIGTKTSTFVIFNLTVPMPKLRLY